MRRANQLTTRDAILRSISLDTGETIYTISDHSRRLDEMEERWADLGTLLLEYEPFSRNPDFQHRLQELFLPGWASAADNTGP